MNRTWVGRKYQKISHVTSLNRAVVITRRQLLTQPNKMTGLVSLRFAKRHVGHLLSKCVAHVVERWNNPVAGLGACQSLISGVDDPDIVERIAVPMTRVSRARGGHVEWR